MLFWYRCVSHHHVLLCFFNSNAGFQETHLVVRAVYAFVGRMGVIVLWLMIVCFQIFIMSLHSLARLFFPHNHREPKLGQSYPFLSIKIILHLLSIPPTEHLPPITLHQIHVSHFALARLFKNKSPIAKKRLLFANLFSLQ